MGGWVVGWLVGWVDGDGEGIAVVPSCIPKYFLIQDLVRVGKLETFRFSTRVRY